MIIFIVCFFFFSSRRRHTRSLCDWSSDVCSSPARHRRSGAAFTGLGVGEIDEAVLGEARIQCDVQQTTLASRLYLRYPPERLGDPAAPVYDPQPSRPLGDEHTAVRQKLEGPGMLEAASHGLDAHDALRGARGRR